MGGIQQNPQGAALNLGTAGGSGSVNTQFQNLPGGVQNTGSGGGNSGSQTNGIQNGPNGTVNSTNTQQQSPISSATQINPGQPAGAGTGGNLGQTNNSTHTQGPRLDLTNPAGATVTFASFLNDAWMNDPNLNINALVQAVLRNSYQDNQQDLKNYALKVEFYNNLKKNIRGEIASARAYQSANATSNGNAAFTNGGYVAHPTGYDGYNGSAQVNTNMGNNWGSSGANPGNGISPTGTINNANDLNNYISTMEEYLTSVGDDAQLAQVDLQNMAQNQQQTLQTLSNLSKSFNDVSMAIIRNIQG